MTYKEKRDELFRESENLRRELLAQSLNNRGLNIELVVKYYESHQRYLTFFVFIYSPFNRINLDDEIK